jgi:hypothetical protein
VPRLATPACLIFILGWLGTFAACSVPPERSILEEFFAAARLRDTTVLKALATTTFEPLERGIVVDFDVDQVTTVNPRRKTVTIDAQIHRPNGVKARQRLVVTLEQGVLQQSAEAARRWIVTNVEEAGG